MQRNIFQFICLSALVGLLVFSCKHDPFVPIDPPIDPPSGGVCDPDTVYFQNTVLPILVSNCTESGCHNALDHEDGVVLDSYQSLLSTVEHVTVNDWVENKLIKFLETSDLEKRMPQNKAPLSPAQINLLKTWVNQGAQNNACDANFGGCDTITGAKYIAFVKPLIQSKCMGCHSGNTPQGNTNLSTYADIKAVALNGKLYNSVTQTTAWMPKGGAKLDDCTLIKLKTWIDAGALEN